MKYSTDILKKNVIIDDYIPLLIKAERKSNDMEYLYYRDENKQGLLEVGFDSTTQQIYKICLVICKDHRVMNAKYTLTDNCIVGDLLIDIPDDILTATFFCEIYKDAIKVVLSGEDVCQTVASDNLAWEINAEGKIVSLIVFGQSEETIMHSIDELSA